MKETHRFSLSDKGEVRATVDIWDMRDAQGGSSAVSSRNAVRNDLHKEMVGNRNTLGIFSSDS